MRLFICGVRGSTPAPGPDFIKYGGNTSCVAIARDGEAPSLILDAGTGLQRLTSVLGGEAFGGTILLSHLHWDHTHGIPFFSSGDRPDSRVNLLLPDQGDAKDVLERAISPPHFPITPTELRGDWWIGGLEAGEHEIEGFNVLALDIPHKGGRTFGFRISDGASTITYMSDHSPIEYGPGPEGLGEYHEAAMTLADRVDVLIHDSQHTAEEFPAKAHFGHSAIEYAVGLAETASVGSLLLFHHDPPRTDAQLDAILEQHRPRCPWVEAGAEGTVIDASTRARR